MACTSPGSQCCNVVVNQPPASGSGIRHEPTCMQRSSTPPCRANHMTAWDHAMPIGSDNMGQELEQPACCNLHFLHLPRALGASIGRVTNEEAAKRMSTAAAEGSDTHRGRGAGETHAGHLSTHVKMLTDMFPSWPIPPAILCTTAPVHSLRLRNTTSSSTASHVAHV